jgi:hypothetical protein
MVGKKVTGPKPYCHYCNDPVPVFDDEAALMKHHKKAHPEGEVQGFPASGVKKTGREGLLTGHSIAIRCHL